MRGNIIIQRPKRFSYEKNACTKVCRHSDIYFRCLGDFWFMSKFLVVFCSRSCHGRGFGRSKALLHAIQKVLFLLFIKLLEVYVKESVTNQIPRGRLNVNQGLSIYFNPIHACAVHMHIWLGIHLIMLCRKEKEENIFPIICVILLYRDYALGKKIMQG